MQIRITARHERPSAADKAHIEVRIRKFGHFDEHVNEVHVILLAEKFRHEAELIALGKHVRLSARVQAAHRLEACLSTRTNRLDFERLNARVQFLIWMVGLNIATTIAVLWSLPR